MILWCVFYLTLISILVSLLILTFIQGYRNDAVYDLRIGMLDDISDVCQYLDDIELCPIVKSLLLEKIDDLPSYREMCGSITVPLSDYEKRWEEEYRRVIDRVNGLVKAELIKSELVEIK